MKKLLSIALLLTAVALSAQATVVDHDKVFNAYLKGDFKTWGAEVNKYVATPGLTFQDKCEIANYLYGYIGAMVETKGRAEECERLIKHFDAYIAEMLKHQNTKAMGLLYQAASYGMKAKLHRSKLATYGMKTLSSLDDALEADPDNPIAIGFKGNTKYYAPAIFGGNKKKALAYYIKGVNILARNCPKLYRWNYRAMQLCVVEAYIGTGEKEKAKQYYERVMREEPGFTYLKRCYESGNFGGHNEE